MIINCIRGNIFNTFHPYIAFAVNVEGLNDDGFAGAVTQRWWPNLARTGIKSLGEVMQRTVDDRILYALVCHSLNPGGWKQAPQALEQCLNQLRIPDTEPIAMPIPGSGYAGQMGDADAVQILGGIARSQKRVIRYTLSG